MPTAPEEPVNEPCYSHTVCNTVNQLTGADTGTQKSGVCCVKVGTCGEGSSVSGASRYYEGGCQPAFVAAKPSLSAAGYSGSSKGRYNVVANSSSKSTAFPTITEGCVKQGECSLPYIQLGNNYGTQKLHLICGNNKGCEAATPSDATMDRLLAGSTEAYPDACREIYPRTTIAATHHVVAAITVEVCMQLNSTTFYPHRTQAHPCHLTHVARTRFVSG